MRWQRERETRATTGRELPGATWALATGATDAASGPEGSDRTRSLCRAHSISPDGGEPREKLVYRWRSRDAGPGVVVRQGKPGAHSGVQKGSGPSMGSSASRGTPSGSPRPKPFATRRAPLRVVTSSSIPAPVIQVTRATSSMLEVEPARGPKARDFAGIEATCAGGERASQAVERSHVPRLPTRRARVGVAYLQRAADPCSAMRWSGYDRAGSHAGRRHRPKPRRDIAPSGGRAVNYSSGPG